jgi:hypothetical protein
MSKIRKIVIGLVASGACLVSAAPAMAAPNDAAIKECETAYKNGWTLTEEQVAQCRALGAQSYSQPVTVTNPGGNLPPGQQP